MSDLIDRQHAIDEIRFYITEPDISDDETKIEGYNDGLEMAISILSILSSAEPERKTGKWLYKPNEYDDDTYECSQCGEPWTLIDGTPEENNMKFCPNCGAEMTRGDR